MRSTGTLFVGSGSRRQVEGTTRVRRARSTTPWGGGLVIPPTAVAEVGHHAAVRPAAAIRSRFGVRSHRGLDLAEEVFQVHGVDDAGRPLPEKRLRRAEARDFFAEPASCLIGMEACASSHDWARELAAVGHEVRLMPPSCANPHVKRQKDDAADAEAICEAVMRPDMRFVPVKLLLCVSCALV